MVHIDELETMLNGINISEPAKSADVPELDTALKTVSETIKTDDIQELECKLSNLSLVQSSRHEENGNTQENEENVEVDGLKSLKNVSKVTKNQNENASTEPKQRSEKECPEPKSETQILRKRGPQKGTRPPRHASTPYTDLSGWVHRQNLTDRPRSQLFSSGGVVVQSPERPAECAFIPQDQAPLIPDLAQLLPDLISENQNNNNHEQEILQLDDEIPDEIVYQVLNNDDFFSADLFPDLHLSEMFLDELDPCNDTEQVPHTSGNSVELFSPLSLDTGYNSDFPDSRSSADSPVSSFSSQIGSPVQFSLSPPACTTPAPTFHKPQPRNKYYKDMSEKERQKCTTAILSKAREKDGLNQKDQKNRTLLHISIISKNEVYAVVFLNMVEKSFINGRGAPPHCDDLQFFINQEDDYGCTPLLLACRYKLPKVIGFLLDLGASPSLGEKFDNGTVIHWVCQRGSSYADVLNLLCDKASAYLNAVNSRQETPLHTAVNCHGMLHTDGNSGKTEIVDNSSLIEILLKNNAILSMQDILGRTPLHWMIISKNFGLQQLLYSHARDWKNAVNIQSSDGSTILHYAAKLTDIDRNEHKKLIHDLLICDASPLIRNKSGKYPKDLVSADRMKDLELLCLYFSESTGWRSSDTLTT